MPSVIYLQDSRTVHFSIEWTAGTVLLWMIWAGKTGKLNWMMILFWQECRKYRKKSDYAVAKAGGTL